MNMKTIWKTLSVYLLLSGLTLCLSSQSKCYAQIDNSTVKQLDIHKFMGKWYEIARYEHRFEKGMTHVTADYSLMPDGKIQVVNKGMKNGKWKEITGKAKQPDPKEFPGRLKVSFFLWFYSDYYVLYLSEDYRYAIIGSSSDKYLWVLSRTPQVPNSMMKHLMGIIHQRNYDMSRLVFVDQKK